MLEQKHAGIIQNSHVHLTVASIRLIEPTDIWHNLLLVLPLGT